MCIRDRLCRLFLGHDDATQVTPEHVVGFKDHRLSSINPRTKKPISAKTVKDSDLSALKTLFGWAVSNHRLTNNPATGITIKLGKRRVTRPKGFTDEEAKALLEAADAHRQGNEQPKTSAAKRWVPWLCAVSYTHLDVYKRQAHGEADLAIERLGIDQRAVAVVDDEIERHVPAPPAAQRA